jgi:hypothetical protein
MQLLLMNNQKHQIFITCTKISIVGNGLNEKKYPEIEEQISKIHTKHYSEQYEIRNKKQ